MPENRSANRAAQSAHFTLLMDRIANLERVVDAMSSGVTQNQISDALEELKAEAQKLENERRGTIVDFDNRIQEFVDAIEDLQKIVAELSQPPRGRATFIRLVRIDDVDGQKIPLVEIKDADGRYMHVYCNTEIDANSLRYGQRVVIQRLPKMENIIEILEPDLDAGVRGGAEATVVEILPEDKEGRCVLLTLAETDSKIVAHIADRVDSTLIEAGSHVLYDPASAIVTWLLPPREDTKYLVTEIPTVTFDDIGGLESVKRAIKEKLAWPLLFPDVYKELGLPLPKGFILEGPPGNGKTMIAKAAINFLSEMLRKELGEDVQGHFMHIAGPELLHWFVGRTEYALREEVFGQAKKIAGPKSPVLIFFDEADAFLRPRGRVISSDVHETHVPQFNALMDGLEEAGFVIVMLATNRRDLIDPAAIRPGRFDRTFIVSPPGEEGARAIFEIYLKPEHIHDKYLVPVYTPRDRNSRPRRGSDGKIVKHKFDSDPTRARNYLVDRAIARMYGKGARNVFLRVIGREKKPMDFYFGDFCSGARIKNVIDRAKEYAIRRFEEEGKKGHARVSLIDILVAIEDVFAELRRPLVSREEVRNWLATEGRLGTIGDDAVFEFPNENDTLEEDTD